MKMLDRIVKKSRKHLNENNGSGGSVDQIYRITRNRRFKNNVFVTSNSATEYQTQRLRRMLKDKYGEKVVVKTRFNSTLELLLPPKVNLTVLIKELEQFGLKIDKKV